VVINLDVSSNVARRDVDDQRNVKEFLKELIDKRERGAVTVEQIRQLAQKWKLHFYDVRVWKGGKLSIEGNADYRLKK
jgi:hypothetical protein